MLLGDLGVGGERGELAADLRLHLLDAVLQFVHFDHGLGRGLVAEESVDRIGVDGVGVVSLVGLAEHGVSFLCEGAPPAPGACTYIGALRLVLELLLTSC